MSYCPKCGGKVREEMAFCPKCGAPLKAEQPSVEAAPPQRPSRSEKAEKHEKHEKEEKGEKTEKREKHEFTFIGPLIGGLVLIFLGLMAYLHFIYPDSRQMITAVFLIVIGVIVVIAGIYASMVASRRHPKT